MQENSSRQSGLLTPVALCWIIDPNVSKELCRRWVHALAHKNARTCPLIALLFSGKVAARVLIKRKEFSCHTTAAMSPAISRNSLRKKRRDLLISSECLLQPFPCYLIECKSRREGGVTSSQSLSLEIFFRIFSPHIDGSESFFSPPSYVVVISAALLSETKKEGREGGREA